jgi:hypothetical protein
MLASRIFRAATVLPAVFLLGSVVARAQLAASSPFLPATASGATAVSEGAPIELRGIMETGSGRSFCIFDPAKKVSTWVLLNEKDHDFVVKAYDPANETVTVNHGGRVLTLAMRAVKVASSGQAESPAPLPTPSMPAVSTPVTQSVVVNPTPADEARRLEAVSAEVRRRRALREQASILAAASNAAPVVEAPAPQPPAQQQRQRQPNQGQNQNRTRQRN